VHPAREREVESLFAIGNGYISTRASIAEAGRFSRPGTFAAGIYIADGSLGPRLAVLPHWLHVEVTVEDQQLSLETGRILAHRRRLDLRPGVLWRQLDASGRITYLQLASLADRHLLLQSVTVTAENYAGRIGLTTRLGPSDVKGTDIEQIVAESGAVLLLVADAEIGVAGASEPQGLAVARPARHDAGVHEGKEEWSWEVSLGETIRLPGSAAAVIVQEATERQAAMIVMCPQIRTDLQSRALGSVAEAVLRTAPCPIVLVPSARGRKSWALRRLLVPHDGTPTSAAAMGPATEFAAMAAAELVVLHVATPDA
jgi:nucleotide-binding universal stress UspA family protein